MTRIQRIRVRVAERELTLYTEPRGTIQVSRLCEIKFYVLYVV